MYNFLFLECGLVFFSFAVFGWLALRPELRGISLNAPEVAIEPLNPHALCDSPKVSRFFSQAYALRHVGLSNAIMLSVDRDSGWIPPDRRSS